jgi:hypothetical protein
MLPSSALAELCRENPVELRIQLCKNPGVFVKIAYDHETLRRLQYDPLIAYLEQPRHDPAVVELYLESVLREDLGDRLQLVVNAACYGGKDQSVARINDVLKLTADELLLGMHYARDSELPRLLEWASLCHRFTFEQLLVLKGKRTLFDRICCCGAESLAKLVAGLASASYAGGYRGLSIAASKNNIDFLKRLIDGKSTEFITESGFVVAACASRDRTFLEYLVASRGVTREHLVFRGGLALRLAVEPLAETWFNIEPPTAAWYPADVRPKITIPLRPPPSQFMFPQTLLALCRLVTAGDVESSGMFAIACTEGHFDAVKILVDRYVIAAHALHEGFKRSCWASSDAAIARFLISEMPMPVEVYNEAFHDACHNRRYETAHWLADSPHGSLLQPSKFDSYSGPHCPSLVWECITPSTGEALKFAKWLTTRFQFCANRIHSPEMLRCIIEIVERHDKTDAVRWIIRRFSMGRDLAVELLVRLCATPATTRRDTFLSWLVARFEIVDATDTAAAKWLQEHK